MYKPKPISLSTKSDMRVEQRLIYVLHTYKGHAKRIEMIEEYIKKYSINPLQKYYLRMGSVFHAFGKCYTVDSLCRQLISEDTMESADYKQRILDFKTGDFDRNGRLGKKNILRLLYGTM